MNIPVSLSWNMHSSFFLPPVFPSHIDTLFLFPNSIHVAIIAPCSSFCHTYPKNFCLSSASSFPFFFKLFDENNQETQPSEDNYVYVNSRERQFSFRIEGCEHLSNLHRRFGYSPDLNQQKMNCHGQSLEYLSFHQFLYNAGLF